MESRRPDTRLEVGFRRARTVGAAVGLLVFTTAALPLLVTAATAIDATRAICFRRPWMAVRMLAMWWVFLATVVGEVVLLALVWVVAGFGRNHTLLAAGTRRVHYAACEFVLDAVRRLLSLDLEVECCGPETPGPLVVLVRHAGLIDHLLPNIFLGRVRGLQMRYVLSESLLANPVVDVWGNRSPNFFMSEGADAGRKLAGIAALGANLDEDDAVVLFPEGSRFTDRRREQILESLERHDPAAASRARSLRHVLPPRPAGALALLDGAESADVLLLAHTGLEDLGDLRRLWRGEVVGGRAAVLLWRIPRSEVPADREGGTEWLWGLWSRLDTWIAERLDPRGPRGGAPGWSADSPHC